MARPKDKAPIKKQEILEHFYKVLRDEGFEGASLARIARSMGVHPSLLIHYFSNKEQLTLALVDFIARKYMEAFVPIIAEVMEPRARLESILDMLFSLDWAEEVDLGVFHACHYLSFHNEGIKKRFKEMYAFLRASLVEEFQGFIDAGVMKDMDAGTAADMVIAMTEGLDFYGSLAGGDEFNELARTLKSAVLALVAVETFPAPRKKPEPGRRTQARAAGRSARVR